MPIDMSSAKAPPRRNASTTRSPRSAPMPQASLRQLREDGLNGIGQLFQGGLAMARLYADAGAFGLHWSPLAREAASLADTNEVAAKYIDLVIKVGPFAGIVATALPLVLQLMANHRLIDASQMMGSNVVPPEVLESQMKANIARMQAEAMREQQTAIAEAQRAEREYQSFLRANQTPTQENPAVVIEDDRVDGTPVSF